MTPRSLARAALLSALLLPGGAALEPAAAAAADARTQPAAGASLAAVAPRALTGIFARLDGDSDGFLSPAEWGRHAHRVSDGPRDPDGDGKISLDEFSQSFLAMGNLDQVLPRMRLLWRGKVCLERGLAGEALAVYCSASHQFPGCGVGHLGRGRCLESQGQLPLAREAFARATVESPEDAEAWLNLALVDWRLEQAHPARASPALRLEARGSRLEERPVSPVNSSRQSTTFASSSPAKVSLDKGLEALERLRWLPENTPGIPEELAHARYLLDCVRLRLGGRPDAAPLLQRMKRWQEANLWLATRPEAPAPDLVRQAMALAKQGWYRQALEKLRQAAASPHAGWWPRLASASLEELLGRLADARKSAADARALGAPPAQVEVVELGIELAAGESARARSRLARLREASLPAADREALGWQLIRHGMPGAALEWLEAADRMRNSDRTLLMLAVCCVLEGKLDRAAAYLGRLPGPPPGEPPMLTALAWAAARCNRFSQALSALDEATGQEPRDAGNWLRLALFFRDTGLTEQVVPHLEEGLAVASTTSPDWPSLVFALGAERLRRELERLEPRAAAGWLAGQLERLPVTR